MQHAAKLFSVLLLASALGGCSMAGTGDYFADKYADIQKSQMPQYWGETSGCHQQQPPQPSCGGNFASAQNQAVGQPHGAVASPAYGQPAYTGQNAYVGQPGFAQSGFPQGGFPQAGFGAAPYLNARGGNSRGLRQAYTYGTLGATLYDVDSDSFGIQGRLGWQSKGIFGAEVEGSFGINDDSDTIDLGTGPFDLDTGIDTQIAAFAVARAPVSDRFNVLSRLGYHSTEIDVELDDGITSVEDSVSTDGIAYGVGVEYALNPRTSVRADYTRYDFDGPDADALSLAVSRKF